MLVENIHAFVLGEQSNTIFPAALFNRRRHSDHRPDGQGHHRPDLRANGATASRDYRTGRNQRLVRARCIGRGNDRGDPADKKVLPCSVFLQGEYGVRDLFVGVPCKLGARGLEKSSRLR